MPVHRQKKDTTENHVFPFVSLVSYYPSILTQPLNRSLSAYFKQINYKPVICNTPGKLAWCVFFEITVRIEISREANLVGSFCASFFNKGI